MRSIRLLSYSLAEIQRRLKYLEPQRREHIAQKLNDLLVYAEVAKMLKSELIAIIVLSKLSKWEHQLLHPEEGDNLYFFLC